MEAGTIYQACQGIGEVQRPCQGPGKAAGDPPKLLEAGPHGGMLEVEAASGGSGLTSMATSGKAARGRGQNRDRILATAALRLRVSFSVWFGQRLIFVYGPTGRPREVVSLRLL